MCRITGHFADISVETARALGLEERSAKLAEQRRRGEVEHSQWKRQRPVNIMVMTSSCHHQPSHILRTYVEVCLQYCCSIATYLASQPKDIPLTLMALQRFDNRCHYTHNEPMVQSNRAHIYQSPTKSTWST